ncbi:RNA polymerase II transcription factor B subunit 4 [Ascosphaera atra]|nr:RNA polymerase II transcription factor B subunit 4 [Ascosphaera atra]
MNGVDATEHYDSSTSTASLPPSLLTIVLDTNPYIWSQLHDTLPLSAAVANLLVFINAHLACNYSNRVAVVASHLRHATWLYPTPAEVTSPDDAEGDQEASDQDDKDDSVKPATVHKYKYRPFADIEAQISRNLKRLLRHTPTPGVASASASASPVPDEGKLRRRRRDWIR